METMAYVRLVVIAAMVTMLGLIVGMDWQNRQTTQLDSSICNAVNHWCNAVIVNDYPPSAAEAAVIKPLQLRVTSTFSNNKVVTPGPVNIAIRGSGGASTLRVRLSGYNMYMGLIDINLQRQGNLWQATTPLPTCIPDHTMIWKIKLLPPFSGEYYFTSTQDLNVENLTLTTFKESLNEHES